MSAVQKAPAFVLGIDQAAESGWAIRRTGMRHNPGLLHFGLATDCHERASALQLALLLVGGDLSELLVQFEDHTTMALTYGTRAQKSKRSRVTTGRLFDTPEQMAEGRGAPKRSTGTILGIGEALGYWIEQLNLLGHPQALRLFVPPPVWRKRVLGNAWAGKAEAVTYAQGRVSPAVKNHNVAEGIAICDYGAIDGVANLLAGRTLRRVTERAKKAAKRQTRIKGTSERPPALAEG